MANEKRDEWAGEAAPTRRAFLQTAVGAGVATVVGVGSAGTAQASGGEKQWTFETEGGVFSSPTVVDGTVFVGSDDGYLYAVDAGVSGSSEGSRVMLGTLGHHGDWRYAGQIIPITANGDLPLPLLIGGGAATLLSGLGGYALIRNRDDDSPSAPD